MRMSFGFYVVMEWTENVRLFFEVWKLEKLLEELGRFNNGGIFQLGAGNKL